MRMMLVAFVSMAVIVVMLMSMRITAAIQNDGAGDIDNKAEHGDKQGLIILNRQRMNQAFDRGRYHQQPDHAKHNRARIRP